MADTRMEKTKHYGSLLIEFTHPEHADAAIREQLLQEKGQVVLRG